MKVFLIILAIVAAFSTVVVLAAMRVSGLESQREEREANRIVDKEVGR